MTSIIIKIESATSCYKNNIIKVENIIIESKYMEIVHGRKYNITWGIKYRELFIN